MLGPNEVLADLSTELHRESGIGILTGCSWSVAQCSGFGSFAPRRATIHIMGHLHTAQALLQL